MVAFTDVRAAGVDLYTTMLFTRLAGVVVTDSGCADFKKGLRIHRAFCGVAVCISFVRAHFGEVSLSSIVSQFRRHGKSFRVVDFIAINTIVVRI